ncbi:MAG: S8 family peptidase [Velocimicrobium sp.]
MYENNDNVTQINLKDILINVPADEPDVCDLGIYPYHMFPSVFCLTSDLDFEKTGVTKVQKNPNLALFGEGVLVGVIDTGIDYQHKAFLYQDGTSRILSIWDQTIQDGIPPDGIPYGTEYKQEQINLALKSDNPLTIVPSVDDNGHGTAIASIICGSQDLENSFTGIVPYSDLLVVKLKQAKKVLRNIHFIPEGPVCYQESDVIFAARYLFETAKRLRRPLALCIALGTSQSGHDGLGSTSMYLTYINEISQMSVTICAGNEGNAQRHYFGTLDAVTYTKEFELKVSSKDKKFSFEIWPYAPSRFSIEIITPTGESTRQVFPRLNACRKFTYIYEASVIWVNNIISEEETGDQLILVRLENPQEGIWRLRVRNIENAVASFHAWLPAGDFISNETIFLQSNPDTTVLSPGNAAKLLTVTAYNQLNNGILIESGRGYTRTTTAIKPDIAAPGYNLICAAINGGYGTLTGTGAASAYATGIVAMILEWAVIRGNYKTITGSDIKNLLIRATDREEEILYPNNIWGYGRINIDGVFRLLS